MTFYTYIYFDERMLPYYVGKGKGKRAFSKHRRGHISVPPAARILIQYWASEEEAFEMEKWWIALYGRKDLGTGLLLNESAGGQSDSKQLEKARRMLPAEHFTEFYKRSTFETCSKGGRKGIQKMTFQQRSKAGRKNVTSGHMSRIQATGCVMGGSAQGKVNLANGTLHRAAHIRWHANKGVAKPGCSYCQEVSNVSA